MEHPVAARGPGCGHGRTSGTARLAAPLRQRGTVWHQRLVLEPQNRAIPRLCHGPGARGVAALSQRSASDAYTARRPALPRTGETARAPSLKRYAAGNRLESRRRVVLEEWQVKSWLTHSAALALAALALALGVRPLAAAQPAPIYAGLRGEVLLDNSRVLVERFVLEPGRTTGRHTHPADQLLVFVKGGLLQATATGRSALWRDGRVAWHNSGEPSDEGDRNVGTGEIVMIWVTLKPVAAAAP